MGGKALPQAEYDARWVARVRARSEALPSGCIVWTGFKAHNGYGVTIYRGRHAIVHRKMYEIVHRVTLDRWIYVCHKCDTPACWNDEHVFLGTPAENQEDMQRKKRGKYQRATHCKHGHEFTPENTSVTRTGFRQCRTCARIKCRLANGWPRELAESLPPTPKGQRPVNIPIPKKEGRPRIVSRSNLGANEIRALLEKARISQCAAARQIGISERSMRRYVAGEFQMPQQAANALLAVCSQST